MGGSSLRVGRLLGIPIGIHPLWLVIVGLITWSLGSVYFPDQAPGLSDTASYALGFVAALGLFAGILLHELGHAVVARRHGVEVEEIDLWLLGGVARLHGEAKEPCHELRFAAAGPAVTAIIAAILGVVRLTVGGQLPAWGLALLDYELYVNVAILAFNLLPAFPLDGGRIARSLMWRHHGDRDRATQAAARAGRMFGWGLVGIGAFAFFSGAAGGLWFALIGWFLIVASAAEAQATQVAHILGARTASDVMTSPAITLAATITVADAVVTGFSRHLFSAFPVTDADGRAVGLVTLSEVRAVTAPQRTTTLLGAVTRHEPGLLIDPTLPVTELMADPAFRHVGRAVVADADGVPIGLVSVTDIERRIQAEALLPGMPGERAAA